MYLSISLSLCMCTSFKGQSHLETIIYLNSVRKTTLCFICFSTYLAFMLVVLSLYFGSLLICWRNCNADRRWSMGNGYDNRQQNISISITHSNWIVKCNTYTHLQMCKPPTFTIYLYSIWRLDYIRDIEQNASGRKVHRWTFNLFPSLFCVLNNFPQANSVCVRVRGDIIMIN